MKRRRRARPSSPDFSGWNWTPHSDPDCTAAATGDAGPSLLRSQTTKPSAATLELRATQAFNGGDYATALPLLQKAAEDLKKVYRQLDRTAVKGTIHKNAANRKKSRLARKLKALKAPAA